MTIKQQLLLQLENTKIPDLQFLFSEEVLDVALDVLVELLEEERKDFDETLMIKDEEITFETFQDFSRLDLFFSLLNHLQNVKSGEKIRNIIEEFDPKYVDFGNYIAYNKRYYDMICYCRENCDLDLEQKRILDLSIKSYKVKGINLETKKQDRLKEISKQLSELSLRFGNNLLQSQKEFIYIFESDETIKEIPENELNEAKIKAEKQGKTGYLFDSSPNSYISIMKYCSDRDVRKHFYKEKHKFASDGKYSNKENVIKILKLREEKAHILGYKNYAELSLEFKMADTPENIIKLIDDVTNKAKTKAKEEIQDLKTYFKLDNINHRDLTYYSRIYKEKEFKFDDRELKKYFEFDKVLNGLFVIANKLYDIEIKEITTDSYAPEIKYYEVYKNGILIAYFIGDYFYNEDKRSGAWCDNIRPKVVISEKCIVNSGKQEKAPLNKGEKLSDNEARGILDSQNLSEGQLLIPIIINVCAFQKGESGSTLLNYLDVETMFHEFGHALHEMLSESKYSDLSGFNVEWDFVELPSQIMENWCHEKEALALFAKHNETGEDIPEEMLKTMEKLEKYGAGNFTLRQNEFAILDMNLHSKAIPDDIEELDNYIFQTVNSYTAIEKEADYKMYTGFSHIFDGGYGAGYYSYMRAEIIEAQVWEIFKENGIFNKELSKKFLDTILGAGTKKDARDLFFDFAGLEISPNAFLKRKNFVD